MFVTVLADTYAVSRTDHGFFSCVTPLGFLKPEWSDREELGLVRFSEYYVRIEILPVLLGLEESVWLQRRKLRCDAVSAWMLLILGAFRLIVPC